VTAKRGTARKEIGCVADYRIVALNRNENCETGEVTSRSKRLNALPEQGSAWLQDGIFARRAFQPAKLELCQRCRDE